MPWVTSHYQLTHDYSMLPFHYPALDQVVKVTPTIAGQRVRLKLTNYFGKESLTFNRVEIALEPRFTTAWRITYQGRGTVLIAPGTAIETDQLLLSIVVGKPVYVRLIANQAQTYADFASIYDPALTNAALSRRPEYVPPLTERWQNRKGWFSFESLAVETEHQPLTVGVTGDSLVESGMVSTALITYFNQHYPNQISWRLTGISGNQLLHDAPVEEPLYETFGRRLLSRLYRALPAPQLTIALIGANDLVLPFYSRMIAEQNVGPRELANGFKQLAALVRAHDSELLTTTIAPIRLFNLPDPLPAEQIIERQRQRINQWLRQQTWVVDGARSLTDPQTGSLRSQFDFGDHLHWSPRGGERVAQLLIPRIKSLL
ncbi:GDSL-type esterase/lipase family protein [Limosilactobacillus caecicola]|uniref:GDSL-type esterase/lipase family protein n=1 Tax=Limosilactobacillus caecicola TaxID=2941332 RepID=UPI00203E8124|nr:GDSL-type esterase/lipase family protein [Limosilactobacillus caecicola]